MDEPRSTPFPLSFPFSETEFLIKYLATHDVLCPLRQYNLRDLTEPRCPECGREIRLTVGMVEPYLIPWIFTTIFTSMAASIGVLFVGACVAYGPPPESLPPLISISVAYALLAIPATVLLIFVRRKFWQLSRPAQIFVAMGVLGINAALLIANFVSNRF